MDLNTSILKEIIILIMGPIFQILAYFILIKIMPSQIESIKLYHYSILIFNLLPVYPLDGGKLVNLFFSLKFSFRSSLIIAIFISYLLVFLIVILNIKNININLLIIVIFLLYKITKEYKQIELFYNKFLLERYINKYYFKHSIIINNIKSFHRNKRHLVKIADKYYLEPEILKKIYKNR